MSNDCNNINPLKRSGVNQYQRVLKALLPDFVKVDERDNADLILFAKKYASFLKYIKNNNTEYGDWTPFMTMDVSVTLASLIKLGIRNFYSYSKDIFDQIRSTDSSQEADLKNYFKALFDLGFSITHILDQYYLAIPVDFGFKEVMRKSVYSSLPEYYDRLNKYYDKAKDQNLIDPAGTFRIPNAPNDLILSQNFNGTLSDIWTDISIPAFIPTFNGSSTALKIKNTATHNLFTGIFDQYLKVLSGIVDAASGYLDQTLTDFPTHSPHYALYLVFIKLFRYAQDHQNKITARHLDLYYKEILKLDKKKAEPDSVNLTFELAKTADDSYLMKKDTVFKAGKDVDGLELFYALKEDVALGKATVSALKNIYVKKDLSQGTKQVLVSPVANSEDGQGAKLESADKSWKTFGDTDRSAGDIGFVVASSYLYMKEGTRTITFKFYPPSGESVAFNESVVNNSFTLKMSGEKGWVDVPIQTDNVKIDDADNTKAFFSIKVIIDGGKPSIVPYSQATHGYNFEYDLPMALFLLKNARAKEALWDFKFEKIDIDLNVSGLKDLDIENDGGVLNPAKPFDLFGSAPHVGSTFLVGSKELFIKTLQPTGKINAKLYLTWDNYSDLTAKLSTGDNHEVDIEYLEDSVWKNATSNEKLFDGSMGYNSGVYAQDQSGSGMMEMLFEIQNASSSATGSSQLNYGGNSGIGMENIYMLNVLLPTSVINFDLPQVDVSQDYSDNENYSALSKWGFFRLILDNPDFGHSTYAKRLADAAKAAVITSTTGSDGTTTTKVQIDDVTEPYTPKIKEISLEYTVSTELNFSATEEGRILHITPFGHSEISDSDLPVTLLPDFVNEGELFVGLEKLRTRQTLPVLFQVAEGTADPLMEKQDVQWYYLGAESTWIPFEKEDISDNTNGLIKSGIIKFSISKEAVAENTVMGEQLHWLKATVAKKTQAVCKLIEVIAQAAVVQFFDYKNQSNYYKNVLPAGTISKLVFSESSVKKIDQPYASFGGRKKEDDRSFYRRISERLRHKDRAISMWDYERLVLEQFPEIYKVKCIDHAQILEKTSGTATVYIDNELKPGYVLVVPIPDLHSKNAYDPLRPYTSLGTLEDIKTYLYEKISPHVNLDVRNPRFEEIQLEFNIQYMTDDVELYTKKLKEDLEQFMAPWAFEVNTDIEFGGKVSKSALINFIEERSYVNYLSCVKMYRIVDGITSNDLEEAIATSSRSVFVSVKSDDPVNSHIIHETVCEC